LCRLGEQFRFGSEQLWIPEEKPKGSFFKKVFFLKRKKPSTHGNIQQCPAWCHNLAGRSIFVEAALPDYRGGYIMLPSFYFP
jgi:hypothetical protein